MWRKTRSLNKGSNCVGVDPNRNWGYRWGGEGASPRPCTEIYMGTTPFSESETRAVKDFIMKRMSQRDQNRHIKVWVSCRPATKEKNEMEQNRNRHVACYLISSPAYIHCSF